MLSRALAWLGLVGAVAGASACGKSGGNGPVPQNELPARLAVLQCDSVANCCTNANRTFDVLGCKESLTSQLQQQLRSTPSRVTYDPSAAGECLDEIAAAVRCGELDGAADACGRVWRGTVALGRPCQSSAECAPVDFQYVGCTANELTGAKTCTASPRAARGSRGEACAFTCPAGSSCEAPADLNNLPGDTQTDSICFVDEGLFCSPAGVCTPLVELGGDCSGGLACVGDAYCDVETATCRRLKGEDAPCNTNGECESRTCLSRNDTSPRRCSSAELASAETCSEDFSPGSSGPPPNGL